jgi:amino acid transporter
MTAPSICVSVVHYRSARGHADIVPAEEIEDASLTLPKAIIWSVAPNAVLGLLMIVTLAFTAGDIPSILKSATGEPFIQIFYNATQSRAGASVEFAAFRGPRGSLWSVRAPATRHISAHTWHRYNKAGTSRCEPSWCLSSWCLCWRASILVRSSASAWIRQR